MKTLIRCGHLIDGTGSPTTTNMVLVIEGDRILEVCDSNSYSVDPDDDLVDLSEHWVLPGLIDAHLHFFGVDSMALDGMYTEPEAYRAIRSVRDAYRLLEAGFTAVRCLGSPVSPVIARGVNEGIIPGPHIIAAGNFIAPSGGTWDHIWLPFELMKKVDIVADGVEECTRIVRRRLRQGAGVIKVGTSLGRFDGDNHAWGDTPHPADQLLQHSLDELRAIVEEAHRLGVKVSSHSIGDAAVNHALDADIDVIEHGHGMKDETRKRLLDSGKVLVPTLSHMYFSKLVGKWKGASQRSVEIADVHFDIQVENFQRCLEMGIPIAVGSDLIGPPTHPLGEQAIELELMARYGMNEMDVIRAATDIGSQVLGLQDSIGTIETGKLADIVAVENDPLQDITTFSKVQFVMKQGKVFRQSGLTCPEAWLGNPSPRVIDLASNGVTKD